MKFIDGVQPPLTLWGDLVVNDGKTYFVNHEGAKKVKFNPTLRTVRLYRQRVGR